MTGPDHRRKVRRGEASIRLWQEQGRDAVARLSHSSEEVDGGSTVFECRKCVS